MSNWTRVDKELPAQKREVMTLSEGGIEQSLMLQGKLWFHPDGSMYVYYTPVYWREL